MNYDGMPAGPEMDREVAEKVMGWTIGFDNCDLYEWNGRLWTGPMWDEDAKIWRPSSKVGQAWEAAEKMGDGFIIWRSEEVWFCKSSPSAGAVRAATAPLAICRAALEAIPCSPST